MIGKTIFFGGKCDTFVLGRLARTQIAGFCEIAYEIADLPTGELVWPIPRALFSSSKMPRVTPILLSVLARAAGLRLYEASVRW